MIVTKRTRLSGFSQGDAGDTLHVVTPCRAHTAHARRTTERYGSCWTVADHTPSRTHTGLRRRHTTRVHSVARTHTPHYRAVRLLRWTLADHSVACTHATPNGTDFSRGWRAYSSSLASSSSSSSPETRRATRARAGRGPRAWPGRARSTSSRWRPGAPSAHDLTVGRRRVVVAVDGMAGVGRLGDRPGRELGENLGHGRVERACWAR